LSSIHATQRMFIIVNYVLRICVNDYVISTNLNVNFIYKIDQNTPPECEYVNAEMDCQVGELVIVRGSGNGTL